MRGRKGRNDGIRAGKERKEEVLELDGMSERRKKDEIKKGKEEWRKEKETVR